MSKVELDEAQVATLRALLRQPDCEAVADFFASMDEGQRAAFAGVTVPWYESNQSGGEEYRRQQQANLDAGRQAARDWKLFSVAVTALMATGSQAEVQRINWLSLFRSAWVRVLGERRPPWLAVYSEYALDHLPLTWIGIQALVSSGLCPPPKSKNYTLSGLYLRDDIRHYRMVEGVREEWGTAEALCDRLLAEPAWLEGPFWRLFELEGDSDKSLANFDIYSSEGIWSRAMILLGERGALDRQRLLDASLAALGRDFIQYRAGWFSRFHEALKPTLAERTVRIEAYLSLLASPIPPTVSFALKAVAKVDKAKPIAAEALLAALPPVLTARAKGTVNGGLKLLHALALREPEAQGAICLVACQALLHESADVQGAVCDLLERFAEPGDAALSAELSRLQEAVAATLKGRLAPWLALPTPEEEEVLSEPASVGYARLAPERALLPVQDLNELLLLAGQLFEDQRSPEQVERLFDGISRLCAERPADLVERGAALCQRMRKRFARPHYEERRIERMVAGVIFAWLEGRQGLAELPEVWGGAEGTSEFALLRCQLLAQRVAMPLALPLLSAPTHQSGWIAPSALVARMVEWQQAGVQPDPADLVVALLRLAPEQREAALEWAADLTGEAGRAVRLALGGDEPLGEDSPLWIAAWRSRQPTGPIPALPALGPGARADACYRWEAKVRRYEYAESVSRSLDIDIDCAPPYQRGSDPLAWPLLEHAWLRRLEEDGWYTLSQAYAHDLDYSLVAWTASYWPANREAFFARGALPLDHSFTSAEAQDRETLAYLEPLIEPHTALGEMARLALALGLAVGDAALRGVAEEALIASIDDGRFDAAQLGESCARLLATSLPPIKRWSLSLREVSRVSPRHARAVLALLQAMLQGDPASAPRELLALLELMHELLAQCDEVLRLPQAIAYLQGIQIGGKTGKLVKRLLAEAQK